MIISLPTWPIPTSPILASFADPENLRTKMQCWEVFLASFANIISNLNFRIWLISKDPCMILNLYYNKKGGKVQNNVYIFKSWY